jgi:hypothetical protein
MIIINEDQKIIEMVEKFDKEVDNGKRYTLAEVLEETEGMKMADNNKKETFKEWEQRQVQFNTEKSFLSREEIEEHKRKNEENR